ncbi:MAG: hypothetical protein GY953_57855, partial [bacterium]|nr:hypothetical protein [bacterium]
MSTERWHKVKSIFGHAADMEPEQRAAYLDEACAGEPELRAEVEDLLAHHIDSEAEESKELRQVLTPGLVIAQRFRIVRFVASGGMGKVYEAEDLKLGGRLALKTLQPELQANAQFLSRFRREVHLARQVTHRNICRIFD